jgi:hypothetical protein
VGEMMTIKEAILKTLEDNKKLMNHKEIYDYIIKHNLAEFKSATPEATVSAILGDFIRNNDNRVKRVKTEKSTYLYYLSKYENEINFENEKYNKKENINYKERDLHKLFVTYLKSKNIYAKTIYHEVSKQSTNKKWIHPDIIGVEFLQLKSKITSKFLKTIDKKSFFNLYSYELKREIKNDYELKESYFQAVSNSSWANYGYLVALEINDNLLNELQRLNQSFGIGFILLNSYPYESKILFNARYKELDIKTIDRLCEINSDFEKFIKTIEKYLKANDDYLEGTKKEMIEFCDKVLKDDNSIYEYCRNKHIPINEDKNLD